MKNKVGYVYHKQLAEELDKIPSIKSRAKLVHGLIESYGLLQYLKPLPVRRASIADLRSFHSHEYLKCLLSSKPDESQDPSDCGIGYDCPRIPDPLGFASLVAGATLTAAEALITQRADVAINWNGGWHHGHRDAAAGFCYVNDIVIGILKLCEHFRRVLYVDLDVHHGDGVEEAFACSRRVVTVSFHVHEAGFFPCSGAVNATGMGPGRGHSINAPYRFHVDSKFVDYFKEVFELAVSSFSPDVFVVQCGADVLAGDPLGGANLTIEDMLQCIAVVQAQKGPKLYLGGGGYIPENASRYWTRLTALILEQEIDEDVPEHEFFLRYGPDYTTHVERKRIKDLNTKELLQENVKAIRQNLLESRRTAI